MHIYPPNPYLNFLLGIAKTNKYSKYLHELVSYRIQNPADTNKEIHHILPKSFRIGGEKDPLNLVSLTTREHFVVHKLMTKIFDGKRLIQMKNTMIFFLGRGEKFTTNSLQYEFARRMQIEATKGRKFSKAALEKMSAAKIGKALTQKHKDGISSARRRYEDRRRSMEEGDELMLSISLYVG